MFAFASDGQFDPSLDNNSSAISLLPTESLEYKAWANGEAKSVLLSSLVFTKVRTFADQLKGTYNLRAEFQVGTNSTCISNGWTWNNGTKADLCPVEERDWELAISMLTLATWPLAT